MPQALVAMSHSPLLHHVQPSAEVKAEVEAGFETVRAFIRDFDPDLIINFAPDHYKAVGSRVVGSHYLVTPQLVQFFLTHR